MKTLRDLPVAARIGDSERQQAAAALGEHWAAGRLDTAEFDERTALALAARTDLDLAVLLQDLPSHPFTRRRPGLSGVMATERGRLLLAATSSGLVAGLLGLAMGPTTPGYFLHYLLF